ncbi:MAG TPA: hypothetical protein DCS42_14535 [Nitrospiraceae bacterium]|nr:MAG: hypothetical protein A2072_01595 [Nitrospirae bacterium GWC1_57_7]OGW46109.1 MAG: hypothetical protein A2X57_03805 [Nitrospirae bacterium GWD2_57_8]HAS55243.1 hypothetical protein [Nitrospiraceae bacterium]
MRRTLTRLFILVISCFILNLGCADKSLKTESPETQRNDDADGHLKLLEDRTFETPEAKKFGPFNIGQKRFFLTYHYVGPTTGALLEIKDQSGVSFFKEAHHISHDSLLDVEGAFKLEGRNGEGIIVYYDAGPNAPPCGPAFQIFSLARDSFKPLSTRISFCGHFEKLSEGAPDEIVMLPDGNILNVGVWSDSFGIRIPLKVDFQKMTITPSVSQGIFDIDIPYSVEPINTFSGHELTIYGAHSRNAKNVSIGAAEIHTIEFVKAYAEVQLTIVSESQLNIQLSNEWLKVKVNGHEGWVNGTNDYRLLGLPLY